MKISKLIALLLICNAIVNAQSSDWQNDPFGDWITVHSEPAGSISISFKLAPKYNICKGMAYSFYRIENTFNEKVKFNIYFSYTDCDGNTKEYHDLFYFENAKINQDNGLWFFGYRESGVHNIRIADLKFPDREQALKEKKDAEIEAKRKQEEVKKQEEEKKIEEKKVQIEAEKQKEEIAEKERAEQKIKDEEAAEAERQRLIRIQENNDATRDAYAKNRAEQNENARSNREAMSTLGVGFAGLINEGISSNNEASYYRGFGSHLGLNIGLTGGLEPMAGTEVSSSSTDNGNGSTTPVITTKTVITSPVGVGITGGLEFDPLLSEFIGIGCFANGTFGISPTVFLDVLGTSSSSYDLSTSYNLLYWNLSYGATFSLGFKPVKLLLEYSENRCSYSYSEQADFSSYSTYGTYNSSTITTANAEYVEIRNGIGLRFGSYNNRTCYDIMYYYYTPVDVNKMWALSNPQNLFKLRIWSQSIFKFETTVGFNINSLNNDLKYADRKDLNGFYLSVGIVYCKDFFSKSYFK